MRQARAWSRRRLATGTSAPRHCSSESARAVARLGRVGEELAEAGALIANCLRAGGKLLAFGDFNRPENVRQIPPGDPDYVRLIGRRSDAEAANRRAVNPPASVAA